MKKRSGGPQTTEGKARSRHNATTHGIYSESPVLPGVEREEDWLEHRRLVFQDLAPESYLQEILAEQIAVNTWRRKRLIRWERELVRNRQWDIAREVAMHATMRGRKPSTDNPDDIARAKRFLMDRLVPEEDQLNLLMRYEARLHRQLFQLLNQLQALKSQRNPPPANGHKPVGDPKVAGAFMPPPPATSSVGDPDVAEAFKPPPPATSPGEGSNVAEAFKPPPPAPSPARGPNVAEAFEPRPPEARHLPPGRRGPRHSRAPPRLTPG